VTTDSAAAKPANEVTANPPPAAGLFPPSETSLATSPGTAASASEPYRELNENGLALGRNAMSIWQEMVDRHGFTGAYESVKRFVRKLRGPSSPEARAVITTAPGEEAQVDYGTGPTIRDPNTGTTPLRSASTILYVEAPSQIDALPAASSTTGFGFAEAPRPSA
jgi:hypothetical protein